MQQLKICLHGSSIAACGRMSDSNTVMMRDSIAQPTPSHARIKRSLRHFDMLFYDDPKSGSTDAMGVPLRDGIGTCKPHHHGTKRITSRTPACDDGTCLAQSLCLWLEKATSSPMRDLKWDGSSTGLMIHALELRDDSAEARRLSIIYTMDSVVYQAHLIKQPSAILHSR